MVEPPTPERDVGGSIHLPPRVVSLSKDTFNPRKVLGIPRKLWLCPDMTEKLFTGTLRLIKTKNQNYLYSENKDADQLCGYHEADLRLCFRILKKPVFSRCSSIIVSTLCTWSHIATPIHKKIISQKQTKIDY